MALQTRDLLLFLVLTIFGASVCCEPLIEAQDPSLEEHAEDLPEKRWHNQWCSRRCYYHGRCPSGYYCYRYCCRPRNNQQRLCSHHSHCPQGWYCYGRVCRVLQSGYCLSGSNCANTQCCAKYHSSQSIGYCRNLKKPGEWCPVNQPAAYHCGCVQGYACKGYYHHWGKCVKACSSDSGCQETHCCSGGQCKPRKKANQYCPHKGPDIHNCGCEEGYVCKNYGHSYWGRCEKKRCSSDSSCQKSHCCSGGQCKPRKKANDFCPLKGADIYHCGCIEGYYCKKGVWGNYWGKCEQIVPPTEEPGSGLGE